MIVQKRFHLPNVNGEKHVKASLSLPVDILSDIDTVASHLGYSRSALVSVLLANSLPRMIEFMEKIPPSLDPDLPKRLRGQSAEYIEEVVKQFWDSVGEE